MNPFERSVYSYLKKHGFAYRFPDSAIYPQGVRRLNSPSDFLYISNGQTYFIECKSVMHDRFPLNNITANQWRSAAKVTKEGAKYYFVMRLVDEVFVVPYEEMKEFKKKNLHKADLQAYIYML